MSAACQQFRIAWLDEATTAGGHRESCTECAAWVSAAHQQQQAFASIAPRTAPAALDVLVERELGGERLPRLVRVLGSAIRHTAPPQLDERVALLLRRAREQPSDLQALGGLESRRAPEVLSRLIEEELAEPERHRAERFAGTLGRVRAPAELAGRVEATVRRRTRLRLVVAPLASLSAAALVVWLALRQGEPESGPRPFTVVHARSVDELHPLARHLATSLGGVPERNDGR